MNPETLTVANIVPTEEVHEQFGTVYFVKFTEKPETYKWSIKRDPPMPGETVQGTITGDRFKKYRPPYNAGAPQAAPYTPRPQTMPPAARPAPARPQVPQRPMSQGQDPFTMYLSYAKDIAVALINKTGGLNDDTYADILAKVSLGGHQLYDARTLEGAKAEINKKVRTEVASETTPEISQEELNAAFPIEEEFTVDEAPKNNP